MAIDVMNGGHCAGKLGVGSNFVIVGLGGSGSMFLAEQMKRASGFDVTHEGLHQRLDFPFRYEPDRDWTDTVAKVNDYLREREGYGDVNTYARFYYERLHDGVQRAVIVRNPFELAASWFSAVDGRIPPYFWLESFDSMRIFKRSLHQVPRLRLIDFKKMTSDRDYLAAVVRFFCGECAVDRLSMAKVNSHKKTALTFDQVPELYRDFWVTIVGDTYDILQEKLEDPAYTIPG